MNARSISIISEHDIHAMWDTYALPEYKRIHCRLVRDVAVFLAKRLIEKGESIDVSLLSAAALLHDIDKGAVWQKGEKHPDAAVRILRDQGFEAIARVVKTHPVHAIEDASIRPRSWEDRLLFLADKMVKTEIITVDTRFDLWMSEDLPGEVQDQLRRIYPLVKRLEYDVFSRIDVKPEDVAVLAKT